MTCLTATFNWEPLQKAIKQVQFLSEDDESNLKYPFPDQMNYYFAFKHSNTPYLTRSKLLYIEPAHVTAKTTRLANSSSQPQRQALSPQSCHAIQGFKCHHECSAAKNHQQMCTCTNSFGHWVVICSQPLQKLWRLLLLFQTTWRAYTSEVYVSSLTSSQDLSFKNSRCSLDSNRKVLNKIRSCILLPGP